MLQPIQLGTVNSSPDQTSVPVIPVNTQVHSELDQIMSDHPSYTSPVTVTEDEVISQFSLV